MSTILHMTREASNVSLREMARRVGVSPAYLSDIERCRRSVSLGTRIAICREYGVAADVFESVAVRYSYIARSEPADE